MLELPLDLCSTRQRASGRVKLIGKFPQSVVVFVELPKRKRQDKAEYEAKGIIRLSSVNTSVATEDQHLPWRPPPSPPCSDICWMAEVLTSGDGHMPSPSTLSASLGIRCLRGLQIWFARCRQKACVIHFLHEQSMAARVNLSLHWVTALGTLQCGNCQRKLQMYSSKPTWWIANL